VRNQLDRRADSVLGADTPLPLRLLCTPLRCHIASGIVAAGLIAIAGWMGVHPEWLATDRSHTPEQIEDAITLISSRNQMHNRFNKAAEKRSRNQVRIDQISQWLPASRSWDNVRSTLQNIAASCDVTLISLDRGSSHNGKRVTVLDSKCEIQGSYEGICKFLQQIVTTDLPIWCSEIRVVRGEEWSRFSANPSANSQPVNCLASLSLRIPFAGKDTTAAKLLVRSHDNES